MSKYINFGPGWLAYIVNIPAYFPPICPFCKKPMKPASLAGLSDAIQYYSDAVSADKPTYICTSMVPNPNYGKNPFMPGPKEIPCKNHYKYTWDPVSKRRKPHSTKKFVKSYFTGLPVKFDPFE